MPKVTLLGRSETRTFHYFFGKKEFVFSPGVPKEVPVAVALSLRGRMDKKRKPMFKVEELPSIVSQAVPSPEVVAKTEQNVFAGPRQMRLGQWL